MITIKKLNILLLLLLSLLMIGAVSGANDTEDIVKTDISSDTNIHDLNNDNNNAVMEKTNINNDILSNNEEKYTTFYPNKTKNNDIVGANKKSQCRQLKFFFVFIFFMLVCSLC